MKEPIIQVLIRYQGPEEDFSDDNRYTDHLGVSLCSDQWVRAEPKTAFPNSCWVMLPLLLWEPHQGPLLNLCVSYLGFELLVLNSDQYSKDFGMCEVNKDKKENAVTSVSKSNGLWWQWE